MKNGYMFFLNLGNITKFARVALLPVIIFALFAKGFFLMGVGLLLVIICIALSVIRAPSDEKTMSVIEDFHRTFEERVRIKTKAKDTAPYLRGYRVKGKMFLKRHVGKTLVYPSPMTLAVISNPDGESCLLLGGLSLLKNAAPVFEEFRIDENVSIESSVIHHGEHSVTELNISIRERSETISIILENTHKTREYLEYIKRVMDAK
ncbi:MAG: hypothetical protein J6Q82_04060 [Clostridia bacterium]|nr:hypothetical protein [Clostridia bacterium]